MGKRKDEMKIELWELKINPGVCMTWLFNEGTLARFLHETMELTAGL